MCVKIYKKEKNEKGIYTCESFNHPCHNRCCGGTHNTNGCSKLSKNTSDNAAQKNISALANTTNLAIADHGPMSGWEIGENGSGEAAIDFTNKYMIPYLKVSKIVNATHRRMCL
jgi:hypothetical protein